MSDPSAAIRAAVLARMRAVLNPVGVKVYVELPSTRAWPYVHLRTLQVIPDDTDCLSSSESFIDFDAWSKRLDHSETAAITSTVRLALENDLEIVGHRVVVQDFGTAQQTDDPDPSLARAAMTLRLETEAA